MVLVVLVPKQARRLFFVKARNYATSRRKDENEVAEPPTGIECHQLYDRLQVFFVAAVVVFPRNGRCRA